MASRPQGTKFKVISRGESGIVMTGIGNLYSLSLNWRGVSAGNRVLIHDGTDATGDVIEEIVLNNANSTPEDIIVPLPAVGKEFGTGLFVNLSGVPAGEVNVSVGYDANG